ncbi:UDP-N-acetylglucosamine 4,6-dehydratase [Ciceribacter lividus]|uniref:UDP-N-acetylglucosamine 4,6-dehydratase n=1 Tax=Ciceribacter lividus TaxID=1197950 RepID=A0A6I7HM36_9HYPH|nr:UDP-N-acetylglucosamine 4,6-dehydratase (inverting) [Ciceribacter lividus]RCW22486.1 UDP-N-acetylglucosamine 4,6-dehydratase [Ciceribacter lividus]
MSATAGTRQFDETIENLDGASILVTGGTGSFGRSFVKRLFEVAKPHRVVVLSRDEQKHQMMIRDPEFARHPEIRYFIGDVRDLDRLQQAMSRIDYVVHAAAMKHIDLAEYNPFECIKTNVMGAENVVKAALACGVRRVIALSTDKACNPVNLYGASKLASDKIFIAGNNLAGNHSTRFSVVRYGNVLGSAGSVVPFFRKLMAEGTDHIPITDERMTRFWITLRQGVNFVLSNFTLMRGGEIFIPKIPSSTIPDLAQALAPDLPTKIIGIRPGEKLHEAMITQDDAKNTVDLGDRYVIEPSINFFEREPFQEARPVDPYFVYSSDRNSEWLDIDSLRHLIDRAFRGL